MRPPRPPRLCVLFVALSVLAMVVLLPTVALARAGGGGGYGGGGGGGGGGFGGGGGGFGGGGHSGSGSGEFHPVVFVIVVIVVAVFLIVGALQGKEVHRGRVIRRGGGALDGMRRTEAVARLQQSDPEFDEQGFYRRVAAAFMKIQKAWSRQKLEPVRAFVSDGIYERFSLQIEEQRDLGYRNRMDNVKVHQTLLSQVESDQLFDMVTVRIRASALDYRERLANGTRIAGTTRSDTFVEYWTFLRGRGVKTHPERPGLIEGNCPNCGADVEMNQSAKCTSCESLVRSGQYDWVLCEITQECEWRAPESRFAEQQEIPGIKAYRRDSDPGFNVQHLEDRASVVFWRKVMADRLGDAEALAKIATPEFCRGYANTLKPRPDGRRYYGDCAVGSVETLGVLPGHPMDRALVEIRWSGKRFAVAGDGPPQQMKQHGSLFRQIFVLGRRSGVRSDVGLSVSSSHCPSCGAPETKLTSHACEFCGEVLGDGSHDWVLLEIQAVQNEKGQELLRQLRQQAAAEVPEPLAMLHAPKPQGTELLAWAIKLALADNQLDGKERTMLRRVARRRGVRPEQLETLIEAARNGEMDVPEPRDRQQARQWLEAMADVALADGRIHRAEADLLAQAGKRLDWSRYDVKLLLKRRKTELYQAAREQLVQQKQSSSAV